MLIKSLPISTRLSGGYRGILYTICFQNIVVNYLGKALKTGKPTFMSRKL